MKKPKLPPKPKVDPAHAGRHRDHDALWEAYRDYYRGDKSLAEVSLAHGFSATRLDSFVTRHDLPLREPRGKGLGAPRHSTLPSSRRRFPKGRNDKYGTDQSRINLP